MATYYIRKTGNNSSAGTSAGTAWLTLGKALSTVASGDTVYVGAGVYREVVTVSITSPTAETKFVADVEGDRTGDPGEVRWTARTTNDKTAPAASYLCDLAGRDYFTFQRFVFEGGTAGGFDAGTTATSTNVTFSDCTFITGAGGGGDDNLIRWTNASGAAANWVVERCVFLGAKTRFIFLDGVTTGGSDYDVGFVVRNCLFLGGPSAATLLTTAVIDGSSSGGMYSSGGGGAPGGLVVMNCTCLVGGVDFVRLDSSYSTSVPALVKNNFVVGGGLYAASSGQITEDYNCIVSGTPRTNVSSGTNSKTGTSYAPLVHVGQEYQQLRLPRPFGTPTVDSPLLAFGNAASSPSPLSADFLARPRPSGGGPTWASASLAAGYLEHHDFGVKETTTVDAGSSVKVAGPGDLEVLVPVDAASTTITVKVRRDGSYGGGTLPQIVLLANNELGVATQTVTDVGSSGAFNTLSLSAFTPSAKGWVTLRLVSSSAGSGSVYWDTVSVT